MRTCAIALALLASPAAFGGVEHQKAGPNGQVTHVSDADWQPEGFVNGTPVPATWLKSADITVDGEETETQWARALEVEVPLYRGKVEKAWLKALYTDQDVFIRVRWADATEDRQHHPWTWDAEQSEYVPGPQVEDSVLISFEVGCEWTPSLLSGYVYDFDGWQWMAARSDPKGQAVDLYGNVQDRDTKLPDFRPYQSRTSKGEWVLKFIENHDVDLHADWNELDRVYLKQPAQEDLWVRAVPDGGHRHPDFFESVAPPSEAPEDESQTFPQFSPIELEGGAGEVRAKGQWKDGYWTVEFQRARETPIGHIYDTIFNRLIQFSLHVFDGVERIDQVSESGRLFLQFMPQEQQIAQD